MKRQTALKNLYKILQRIRSTNGIFATTMDDQPYSRIQRAWVFGSVLKGSESPNDIDIFIQFARYNHPPAEKELKSRRKIFKHYMSNRLHGGYRPCKRNNGWKNHRWHRLVRADEEFAIWLRKHIPKVSIHVVGEDRVFDRLDKKCLIYPRCDFDFEGAITPKFMESIKRKRSIP